MTAILIANVKEKNGYHLYLAADSRVTDGDRLISDYNKKIFVRQNGQVTRYYATAGDVGPTDYIIDKLEQFSVESAASLLFEDEFFKTLRATFVMFLVEQTPNSVRVYEIGVYSHDGDVSKNTLYVEKLSLEELKHSYRVLGSGGEHVLASLNALMGYWDMKFSTCIAIHEAFKAAAKVILSINDKVDLFKFKLPKVK